MDPWWQALKKFIPASLNRKPHGKEVKVLPHTRGLAAVSVGVAHSHGTR